MSVNNEIIQYVESLDNYDEKNHDVRKFIKTLKTPIKYQSVLNCFNWKAKHYAELDEILMRLGYAAQDKGIGIIKKYLTDLIREMSAAKYNLLFKADIWNHMVFFEMEPQYID